MGNEGKENEISVQEYDNTSGLRTPLNQVKRSDSMIRGNRRPLASKDNNRTQSMLSVKNNAVGSHVDHTLKRPASNLVKNMPENKLKKYGSVLGMNSFMPRTKSLVLKDTELNERSEEEEEEENDEEDLPLFSTVNKTGLGLGFGSGLKALIKEKEDELQIEYAPKRQEELPHVPNGYEPFDQESIEKLKNHKSPFQVDPLHFDKDEYNIDNDLGTEPQLLSIESPKDDIISPYKHSGDYHNQHSSTTMELASDNESITIDLGEEYKGNGLNISELNSLLD